MASIYDVNPNELIEKAAKELKDNENVKAPEWASYVKTGRHKERVPLRKDWWQIRTAAVLRTIYKYGPIGVSKLRVKYGGKKRRGHKPSRFYPGSGNIIRKILQQLEKAGYLKKEEKAIHRGRRITPQGKSFLDKLSTQIYKGSSKQVQKEEPKAEKPKDKLKEKPKAEAKEEPKAEVKPKEKPKAEVKKEPKAEVKPKEEPKAEAKEKPKEEKKEMSETKISDNAQKSPISEKPKTKE